MSATRIREITLELNQLRTERSIDEQRRTEREKELLQELIRLVTESTP